MISMMPSRSSSYADDPAVRKYFANAEVDDSLQVIRFGEFLVERGVIDRSQLFQVLMVHHLHGGRIGAIVARLGFADLMRIESLADEYHRL
jgi:hypothetical protein